MKVFILIITLVALSGCGTIPLIDTESKVTETEYFGQQDRASQNK